MIRKRRHLCVVLAADAVSPEVQKSSALSWVLSPKSQVNGKPHSHPMPDVLQVHGQGCAVWVQHFPWQLAPGSWHRAVTHSETILRGHLSGVGRKAEMFLMSFLCSRQCHSARAVGIMEATSTGLLPFTHMHSVSVQTKCSRAVGIMEATYTGLLLSTSMHSVQKHAIWSLMGHFVNLLALWRPVN